MTRATEFPLPANPLLVTVGATMHRAATLDGLATAAGLAAEALAETVRAHNRAVDAGETAQLDPPRTPHPYRPLPIRQPPFYAVPLVAGITYTMGGIAIDGFCRVRHRDGGVLDGLYAAGSATGGHEGGPHAGYTGGLSKALTFGWHAGNTIAAARRTAQAA
jgi:fumarate reductase flavoprotein subunit